MSRRGERSSVRSPTELRVTAGPAVHRMPRHRARAHTFEPSKRIDLEPMPIVGVREDNQKTTPWRSENCKMISVETGNYPSARKS